MTGATQVTLLGRFAISVDGRPVDITSPKERAMLARLALEPGTPVSVESLVESLWPDGDHPEDPGRALRYHVWHLRGLLEPQRLDRSEGTLILTRPAAYVFAVDPHSVDAVSVEVGLRRARAVEDDLQRRRDMLAVLLETWRPACFANSDRGPLAEAAVRLDRLRTTVLTDRIAADLDLGRDAELVAELELLISAHPFDERLRGQLMTALYRAGRQVEALAVYGETRTLLVEELGVEPGPELRDIEARILRHDADLDGAPLWGRRSTPASWPLGRRTNLPHPVDSFVGRDAELVDVRRLLDNHRLVTLTGAGGIGKTRLAIEAGRRLLDEYRDGVWIAELASVADEALVPTVVAETWGLAAAETDMADVVTSFLQSRQLLLVLDNCEHVNQAAARLVARVLAEAPDVRIVATSRESLGVAGEAVLRVPNLEHGRAGDDPGAAGALFIDRGRAARPAWQPTALDLVAIERICRHVDGIPLGLELAAGRLRSMEPREISDHLDESLRLLAVASKNSSPRQRTLAATVEWSYRLLSASEQQLFRAASVFVGGFDLAAARAVCGESDATALSVDDLVDSLVDKSLVVASPGMDGTRYRLLEPLRQWAHAELTEAGTLDDAREAHARHFARVISDVSPDYHRFGQDAALRRTAADYPNVRVALATLAELGDVDRHLATTFGLFSFWAHQSMHVEGFESCRRSLDLAEGTPDVSAQVKTAVVGSVCAAWTRRVDAVAMAIRARSLAELLGDTRAIAWAEWALAVVHGNDGLPRGAGVAVDDAETSGHMQRAVELWSQQPEPLWWDPVWEYGLQQLCCSIFLPYGPERLAEFRASKAAFESIGDRGWLAILYAQALDHLEFAGAEVTKQILEEGADIAISPSWSFNSRYRLGALHLMLGEHHLAIEHLTAAFQYGRAAGEGNWTTEARFLAIAHCEIGEVATATQLLESVFVVIEEDRGEREVLRTLAAAAYVLEMCGHRSLAARALGRADPFQDNFVDAIGTVRTRLTDNLGVSATERLMNDGAASALDALVSDVRSALLVHGEAASAPELRSSSL